MDNIKNFGKKEAIIKTLKKYDICFREFESFKYAGNNKDERGIKIFYMTFGHHNYPEYSLTCLCNTNITNNYYVTNNKKEIILVMGKCCIKQFVKTGTKLLCEICNEPHKNRLQNRCNECKNKNLCIDCKKATTDHKNFKYCFECYSKNNSYIGKCIGCKNDINKKYKYCFNCNKKFV